jgi:hypothetical protein
MLVIRQVAPIRTPSLSKNDGAPQPVVSEAEGSLALGDREATDLNRPEFPTRILISPCKRASRH